MSFSLGQRLRLAREQASLTQEQVIEQLGVRFNLYMSQQALSAIEHGRRKVDAAQELPALAAVYGKSLDFFYSQWRSTSQDTPSHVGDYDALTSQERLALAQELISSVLRDNPPHCGD